VAGRRSPPGRIYYAAGFPARYAELDSTEHANVMPVSTSLIPPEAYFF